MVTIRREQMKVLGEPIAANLECRIHAHLQQVFPDRCRQMGEPDTRELIRQGIRTAGTYGIEDDYEVLRYVDMMFLFAPDFDSNEAFAWASVVLNDSVLNQEAKMDSLYRAAMTHAKDGRSRAMPAVSPEPAK